MEKKREPIIAGLTGSIGSGKSAVAERLRALGAGIIDADVLSRQVMSPDGSAYEAIITAFGKDILKSSGEIDRKKLGQIVFSNSELRQRLEKIVHPKVRLLFEKRLAELKNAHPPAIIIYVVPLLFESANKYPELSPTILVTAPDNVCIERVMRRDGCTRQLAERKLAAQMPADKKAALSDIVIVNDGSMEQLNRRVAELYENLLQSRSA
ncbi:MAG: dephospho-CoA kinase [Deltaproteobacteria bacterium]|nr:dephospho-CoA kinase [Deltaproteobacteria bacterium]